MKEILVCLDFVTTKIDTKIVFS